MLGVNNFIAQLILYQLDMEKKNIMSLFLASMEGCSRI